MSLLEEKTPSKQFVMPKEVYTILCPTSLPSLFLLPRTCHAMLFLHIHSFSSHIHYLTPSPHTHTHTHTTGFFFFFSEDARQVTGSTLTIDGGWTTR